MVEAVIDFQNPQVRTAYFEELYENTFPIVADYLRKRGASLQDTRDIFQDALIILFEKRTDHLHTSILSDEAYLMGIVKHLWIRKHKDNHQLVTLDPSEREIILSDDDFTQPSDWKLLALLERTGKKCLELLQAIYYQKNSMDEISKAFGFSSAHSASAQKYKCIEKMKETIKEKALSYEDFME